MTAATKISTLTPRMTSRFFLSALAAVSLCLSAPAHAASILVDGGFEAAGGGNTYYSGQSIDGGAWNVTLGSVYIDSLDPYVYDGSNSLNLTYSNLYVANTLSQTLATVAGQTYLVGFCGDADTANSFGITANGKAVSGMPASIVNNGFPGTVSNSNLFTFYSGSFTATSNSTSLNLTSTGNPALFSANGSVMIDDISVNATTPEPGSIILTLTGIVGLVAQRKRFFKSASNR